jgi:membrane associated rhomboid family serine protease
MLALPRFTPWMKRLAIFVAATWVALAIVRLVAPGDDVHVIAWLALIPQTVFSKLQLWRIATYALVDDPTDVSRPIWAILAFWWFGSPVERRAGANRVLQVLAAGVLGGAAFLLAIAIIVPALRFDLAVGMQSASGAMLAAWGFIHADEWMNFFGLARIKGKHLALALFALTALTALIGRHAVGMVSLGGFLAGAAWMWIVSRRGSRGQSGGAPRKPGSRTSGTKPAGKFRVLSGGRDGGDDDDRKMWN